MSRVYSTLLFTDLDVLGTAPGGDESVNTVVIRDIVVVQRSQLAASWVLNDSSGAQIAAGKLAAGDFTDHWQGRQVIPPGISWDVSVDQNPCSVRVSGYELSPT